MFTQDSFYHYLPVNDLAMHWGIYVTGAGLCKVPPGAEYPPRGHPALYDFRWNRGRTLPEFALLLVTDGQGTFESRESCETIIEPGSIILVLPGKWHRYRPDAKSGWTERWITFNGEVTHRLMRSLGLSQACLVEKVRNLEHLTARFDDLLERIHFHPTQNSVLLSMHAMALLAETLEHSPVLSQRGPKLRDFAGAGVEDELVGRAREIIWTQSHRQLSVAQIARELSVTRRTLERRFRAATSGSVLADIAECRLNRAQRLLHETDLPIKNIAYLAGFPSDEQMRVVFTQFMGLPPGGYRKRARAHKPSRTRKGKTAT